MKYFPTYLEIEASGGASRIMISFSQPKHLFAPASTGSQNAYFFVVLLKMNGESCPMPTQSRRVVPPRTNNE